MKRIYSLLVGALTCLPLAAQTPEALPAPSRTGGLSTTEALWQRHSARSYSQQAFSRQDLGDLLWAACGVNRPATGHLTNPTAMNLQEISVYAFLPDGVYRYEPKAHALTLVAQGDRRELVAGPQQFAATAPVALLLVADFGKYPKNDEHARLMAAADAGIVSQNINLYCAARGWATVTRGTMNVEGLTKLLGLGESQQPLLNNPVGYAPNP